MSETRILFVEDDPLNQLLIRGTINSPIYRFEIVGSGGEALERILAQKFDILFLDILLPDINGYQLTDDIRKMNDKDKKNIPIIAMSATTPKEDKLKLSGINDYISKPFSEEEFTTKVLEHVYGKTQVKMSNKVVWKIDCDYLMKLSKGNAGVIKNMMSIFMKQKEEAFRNFEDALVKKDWNKIGNTAHNLKSSVSLVGVDGLHEIVESIETLAFQGKDVHILPGRINTVKTLLEQSVQELKKIYKF